MRPASTEFTLFLFLLGVCFDSNILSEVAKYLNETGHLRNYNIDAKVLITRPFTVESCPSKYLTNTD